MSGMSDAPQLLIVTANPAPWTDAVVSFASSHGRTAVITPEPR